jgi:hypothetical protein
VIGVGDVMRFKPNMVSDRPGRRVMYVLITRVYQARERACDCLILYDSYTDKEDAWNVGNIIAWPYSYMNDLATWQKVAP